MRLWHQLIIKYLPDKQLLGQHREICALRGLGFGKKHKIINYVFEYPYSHLYHFHLMVMKEMKKRGFKINNLWNDIEYRGKNLEFDKSNFTADHHVNEIIYNEHDISYLKECLLNLNRKNIYLNIKKNSFLIPILHKNNLLNYINIIE